ncbi:MAG: leucine-rich repeat protein [Prevotella sp.]|nr:leucine-rich repeat protein [Prevotella sp.]
MRRITCILLSVFSLCLCPATAWADTEVSTWSELQTALNSSGTVKLTADITASSSESRLSITSAVTVTLDLNGHILSRGLTESTKKDEGQVININNSGASLTITDSNPSASHSESFTNPNGGTFSVTGGVITGGYTHGSSNDSNGGAIRVGAGTLTIQRGTICGNQASGGSGESSSFGIGGAIYLQDGCTFTMTGGSICYNKAHITGGVHCRKDCDINLSGGRIENNVSTYKAGGLAVNSASGDTGSFNLSGSVAISNNSNGSGANNLYLYNIEYKKIQIQGSLEGSNIGVSWADSDPYVVFTNGYGTYNSGIMPTTYFSADNSANYSIGLQGGEVKITNKTLQNAYAVLNSDGTTLTFYFDNNQTSHTGTIYDVVARTWITPGTGVVVDAVKNITTVVFHSSFSSYTFTAGDNWFHGCSNLTTITGISNLDVSLATNLSWMFAGCSSLASVDLSNWNTSNAYHFNNMFNGCSSLTNVTIGPNFKVDASRISANNGTYGNMFTGCTHYTNGSGTITISGSTVPTIGMNIFGDITDGLLVASGLTADQLGLTSNEDAFWLYKGGKFRKFNGQRGYIVIDGNQYAFYNNTDTQLALRKYNYSSGLSTVRAAISNTLTKNSTNYQMVAVQASAFDGQSTLLSISLPASVESIADNSFEDCTSLRWLDLSTADGYSPTSLSRGAGGTAPFANVPKQALVFLYGPTPEGENYVYYDGTNYTCDRMVIYDDTSGSQTNFTETDGYCWNYENPHAFTASLLQNTRQFTEGQHYTVCLPYSLPLPALLKAYTMTAASANVVGFMETAGPLAAFTPYVVVPSATRQLLSTTNVTVPLFLEDEETDAKNLNPVTAGTFTMNGTMRYMEKAEANGLYIMQGNKTWAKIADSGGSYTDISKKYCILPMRAYLRNSSAGARPYLSATFTALDGTTHTQLLQLDEDSQDEVLYDLMGRRVDNPRRGNLYVNRHGKMLK